MTKKTRILTVAGVVVLLNVCIVILSIIYKANISPNFYDTQLSYKADTIQQLTTDSDLIVIATATKQNSQIEVGGVEFRKTVIKLNAVLKGDLAANTEITLLQTNEELSDKCNAIKDGERVLLFLNQYARVGYTIKGVSQGHFIIKDKTVLPVNNNESNLSKQIKKLKTEDAVEKFIQSSK